MAAENKAKSASSANESSAKGRKRKQRYLHHNRPVKKKGPYPLRPGVQGFFITCDGGRERQASHEAINVIDSFFEELIDGKDSGEKLTEFADKPLNKKIKFSDSDSSSSGDDHTDEDEVEVEVEDADEEEEEAVGRLSIHHNGASIVSECQENDDISNGNKHDEGVKDHDGDEEGKKYQKHIDDDNSNENGASNITDFHEKDDIQNRDQTKVDKTNEENVNAKCQGIQESEAEEPLPKKQRVACDAPETVTGNKVGEISIDKLIKAEIEELTDRNKRRFYNLDSGCNGVVFIRMQAKKGEPGPKDVVRFMMTSIASKRKHVSRFILRVLPVEVACYASEEEISRAIKPLVAQYFPAESETPHKFAVLYEARANTGIDRKKIIDVVAKSVPERHKVDLNSPDKTIIVEIVKTICLMGVVERYKELAKYNIRQLTSTKP